MDCHSKGWVLVLDDDYDDNNDDDVNDVTAVQLTSALTARMTSEGSKDPRLASGNRLLSQIKMNIFYSV